MDCVVGDALGEVLRLVSVGIATIHPALILLDRGSDAAGSHESFVACLQSTYPVARGGRDDRSGGELVARRSGPEVVDDAGDVGGHGFAVSLVFKVSNGAAGF